MVLFALVLACSSPPEGVGLVGDHPLNPFPVGMLHMEDGHVALSAADFGLDPALSPLPTERFAWRTGFSVAQTSVVVLDRVEAAALPAADEPTPGASGVRLLDRTTGTWLPVFAELDAHPEARPGTLLIRPLQALEPGHTVAVVLTTDLTDPVERYRALLHGRAPRDLRGHRAAARDLSEQLEGLGLPADEVALAWDFPVGDGTRPLRSAWEQVGIPETFELEPSREAEDDVAPYTWRTTRGTFESVEFLVEDRALALEADGSVLPQGRVDVDLYVQIPPSVADAPAGSVPVLIFGHGIFGSPETYLDTDDDASGVNQLLDELGAIGVALRWRGLTRLDLAGALQAGADFGRIHEITDRLVQGQANHLALKRLLLEGDLLADPVFTGRDGQSLPDAEQLLYYGISLGGIEGAVLLAGSPEVDAAVLHVGGSQWSTMLERSSNWETFAYLLEPTIPDPVTRQRLYAVSQLWWDAVDPIDYTADLADRPFLLQEAIGDQQVPNLTTRALARSVGTVQLEPEVEPVWGLTRVEGPTEGPVYVQIDPEVGRPDGGNQPAEDNGAHEAIRHYPGVAEQQRVFLSTGRAESFCGATACSASSQGG